MQVNFGNWLPVRNPFEWLHVYTNPVGTLPIVKEAKTNSFTVDFPLHKKSLYLAVHLFPIGWETYPLLPKTVDTVFGQSPRYVVRFSFIPHEPTATALFIPDTKQQASR